VEQAVRASCLDLHLTRPARRAAGLPTRRSRRPGHFAGAQVSGPLFRASCVHVRAS
jgi:hypothetical protein